ncbi:hypothetical protein [Ruminococcus sp.]|uniref:hypothetical protein n=1 Tax=Ruminococcus sp. TaxID=41978 RepID=UPI0025EB7B9F|nr:hypothetical protein [Ruminococcus sp.]MBR1431953.1 hypothetical protein [Ruminococcus sp.]
MKEKREFEILENADDKNIELLAKVPVLTRDEKDRMLRMSRDKLNERTKAADTEEQVSGVERYSRPKWHRFVSIAACAALVAGLAGTAVYLSRGKKPAVDDPVSEITIPADEITSEDTDKLDVILKDLIGGLNELELITDGGGVEVDESDRLTSDEISPDYSYYRVTDERFSTVDDVVGYFRKYSSEQMFDYRYAMEIYGNSGNPLFMESDGGLYFNKDDAAEERARSYSIGSSAEDIEAVYSDTGAYGIYDKAIGFSVPAYMCEYPCRLDGKLILEGGSWRIEEYSVDYLLDDAASNVIVSSLLFKLEEFDMAYTGPGVEVDESDLRLTTNEGGVKRDYYRVTDQRFGSLSDVKDYFDDYFTEDYLSINSSLWEGYGQKFIEADGVLCYERANTNAKYTYISEPVIENADETSFDIRIVRERYPEGFTESMSIRCVLYDNRWRILWATADNSAWHEADYLSLSADALKSFFEIEAVVYGNTLGYSDEPLVKNESGNELTYKEVISDKFSSVSDIMNYISDNCCDELLAHYEKDLYVDGAARYIEEDGKLYALDVERPFDKALGAVSDYETLDETEEDFTIRVTPPHEDAFYINVKNVDGEWKLSGCSKY